MESIIRRLKDLLWFHGLLFMLVLFNILPLFTAIVYKSPLIDFTGDLTPAILYQTIALLLICLGYKFTFVKINKSASCPMVVVKKKYFYILSLLSVLGVVVAYVNITMFSSIGELQQMMLEGDDVTSIREESGSGGLGGILKMFSAVPLFAFLSSSALLLFCKYNQETKKILRKTIAVSLICTFLKVLLVFDRLTILAMLIVYVYNYLFNRSFPGVLKIVTVSFLLIIVSFLTLLRMSDIGMMGFLGTYFNLGVVNLEINIEKQVFFNYDFSQTFLAPLSFIAKFFGINYHSYGPADYCWNHGQSFWGFFFIDFNWGGLFLFPILGVIIKKIEATKYKKTWLLMLYFVFSYAAFSFVVIPIIRSMEFWLMIVTSLFISKAGYVKFLNNRQIKHF